MTDLPTLEAALFQKELDTLAAKLAPLVQGIRDVFAEYGDSNGLLYGDSDDLVLVGEWLRSLPDTSQGYFSGYYLQVSTPRMRNLPPLLEKIIRQAAIQKHLEGVATPPPPPPPPPRPALPQPLTEAPEMGSSYYVPSPRHSLLFDDFVWGGDDCDLRWLAQRLCYATAEDAIAVAKALLETLNQTKS
jgi:hypothetical protein